MKKSNLKKVLIPLTIAILFFSFASTVNATDDNSRVTIRPLSDWRLNNPAVTYAWGGYDPGGEVATGIFWSYWWYHPPNAPSYPEEGTYDGYIKERELNDGRAELTIYLSFRDMKVLYVRRFPDPFPADCGYALSLIDEGTMSGKTTIKLILPEPGMEIPNFWWILFGDVPGAEFVSEIGCLIGFGTLSDYSATHGYTPGATAKITVVQRALWNPLKADPMWGMWPVEIVDVQEMPN